MKLILSAYNIPVIYLLSPSGMKYQMNGGVKDPVAMTFTENEDFFFAIMSHDNDKKLWHTHVFQQT